jgi:hypothetical protein
VEVRSAALLEEGQDFPELGAVICQGSFDLGQFLPMLSQRCRVLSQCGCVLVHRLLDVEHGVRDRPQILVVAIDAAGELRAGHVRQRTEARQLAESETRSILGVSPFP